MIRACQLLEPTFGGINLEDIKAPECFVIEEELRRTMKIPVFHDDQHGTAIISGRGAAERAGDPGKNASTRSSVVFNGAGASAHFLRRALHPAGRAARKHLHVRHQRRDLQGPHEGHESVQGALCAEDRQRARLRKRWRGADVFFGLSAANCVTPEMLLAMARAARLCSRWPIPIRRSPTSWRWRRGRTRSWPRAARIIRTR